MMTPVKAGKHIHRKYVAWLARIQSDGQGTGYEDIFTKQMMRVGWVKDVVKGGMYSHVQRCNQVMIGLSRKRRFIQIHVASGVGDEAAAEVGGGNNLPGDVVETQKLGWGSFNEGDGAEVPRELCRRCR